MKIFVLVTVNGPTFEPLSPEYKAGEPGTRCYGRCIMWYSLQAYLTIISLTDSWMNEIPTI